MIVSYSGNNTVANEPYQTIAIEIGSPQPVTDLAARAAVYFGNRDKKNGGSLGTLWSGYNNPDLHLCQDLRETS